MKDKKVKKHKYRKNFKNFSNFDEKERELIQRIYYGDILGENTHYKFYLKKFDENFRLDWFNISVDKT